MRKLVIISIALLAIVGAGIAETIYLDGYFNDLADRLDIAVLYVEAEEYQQAEESMDEILEMWEDNKTPVYIFNNHNLLSTLYDYLVKSKVYIAVRDKTEAISSLQSSAFYARTFATDAMPQAYNVF